MESNGRRHHSSLKIRTCGPLLFVLAFASVASGPSCARKSNSITSARTITIGDDFEAGAAGRAPAAWVTMETHGKGTPGSWVVEERGNAPTGRRVLALASTRNTGATFNICAFNMKLAPVVTIRTKILADGGREDQGGGIVWNLQDENNYYVARWNPLEDNIRVDRVENGVRKLLKNIKITAKADEWQTLAVRADGKVVRVDFNDENLLDLTLDESPSGGRAGVWTKADATTSFDAFEITIPAEPAGGRK